MDFADHITFINGQQGKQNKKNAVLGAVPGGSTLMYSKRDAFGQSGKKFISLKLTF